MTEQNKTKVPAELIPAGNYPVVSTDAVMDKQKGKTQEEVNEQVGADVEALQQEDTNLLGQITAEASRATNAENAIKGGSDKSIQNLDNRLNVVEQLAEISVKEYNPSEYSGLGKMYLKKNIVNIGSTNKNILTQDAFCKDGPNNTRIPNTNTIFVVPFDFEIGSKRNLEITVSASNISNLTSPNYLGNTGVLEKLEERKRTQDATLAEYEAEKTALEEEKQALIDDNASQEEIDAVEAQIVAKQKQIDSLKLKIGYEVTGEEPLSNSTINKIADQTTIVSTTPHYYFFASVTIPAHKVLIAKCPGCVFLGNDLVTIISKDVCYGSTTDGVDTIVYVAYMKAATYNFVEDTFISLPENSILEFNGGSIKNGTIQGNSSSIIASPNNEIFKDNIIIKGIWNIAEIYDGWFKYNYSANTANNQIIHNILGLTHDDYNSTVHIIQNREYLVELPTIPLVLKNSYNVSCRQYNRSSQYCPEATASTPREDIRASHWSWGPGLDAITIFKLTSNTRYIIDSTIKMLPTGEDYYRIFSILYKENIILEGKGTIIGDVDGLSNAHNYNKYYSSSGTTYFGEQGFILRVNATKNLVIKDLTFSSSFGDNIYITGINTDINTGLYWPEDDTEHIIPSDGVTITNVKILYARRNGIAISCSNALVDGCFFEGNGIEDIKGTAPKAGIDFECDQGSGSLHSGPGTSILCNRNVTMNSCIFKDNENDVSSTANRVYGEDTVETFIKNCTFTAPLRLNKTAGLQFEDCFLPLIAGKSKEIWNIAASENLNFVRCIFEDSNIRMPSYTSSDGKYLTAESVNFTDCIYYNDFKLSDHAYVYANTSQLPFFKCKYPTTSNSDYYIEMRITLVGNCKKEITDTSTNVIICVCDYAFTVISDSATMRKCKVLMCRGGAFDTTETHFPDNGRHIPRISVRKIGDYRYFFIGNKYLTNYGVGIDYTIQCCKLTDSTSSTSFARFDVQPEIGVYTNDDIVSRDSITYLNTINNYFPGNYSYNNGENKVFIDAANSPFFYNGKIYCPTEDGIKNWEGEDYYTKHSGNTSQMPTPTNIGFQYINTATHKPMWWDGEMFMYGDGVRVNVKRAGSTADRPTGWHTVGYANQEDPTDISPIQDAAHTKEIHEGNLGAVSQQGFVYFDTTLGKPIYAKEINGTTGVITWVDATGATV